MTTIESEELAIHIPRVLGKVSSATLPDLYRNAQSSLANCYRVDECKDWSDKAEAIRSYARQAGDDELVKTAMRIKGRAVERMGALLEQMEKQQAGRPKSGETQHPISPHAKARTEAGISKDQAKQAQAVARYRSKDPEAFDRDVDRDKPATVSELAKKGRKPVPKPRTDHLQGCTPKQFNDAIHIRGALESMAQWSDKQPPKIVVKVSTPKERMMMHRQAKAVSRWCTQLVSALRRSK